jgi:hypothetical protein
MTMANRSTIAIKRPNGTISQIYCHYDGYDSGVGQTLRDHFTSPELVEELISLGDISYLEPLLHPPEDSIHSFDSPIKGVTVAYRRDRGDERCVAQEFSCETIFKLLGQREEYNYLFDSESREWKVTR